MDSAIISALITAPTSAIATLGGVYLAHILQQRKTSIQTPTDNTNISILRVYAITTTNIVSAFEQKQQITVDNCTVLIRLLEEAHPLHTDDYLREIYARIGRWKEMKRIGRIRHLTIIGCPNIPDICYISADSNYSYVYVNKIDFDDPCCQSVDKTPLCLNGTKAEEKSMITRLNSQFDSYVKYYKEHGTVFCDS